MIKLLGIIFIISGCILSGNYFAEKRLVRIHILEEIEQALQYIYGEIEYAALDITEIFCCLSDRSSYCKDFFLIMCGRLSEREGGDFSSMWTGELKDSSWYKYLLYEDRLFMEELGKNIGNLDRQSQLHTLEIFKCRLNKIIADARSEYKGHARVCHVVGATAGIFISILIC